MDTDVIHAERASRLLSTLEQLLAIDAITLKPALDQAAQAVATVLSADKVDVFLYQPENHSLQAVGVSDTPMGRRQAEIGMDRLPIMNGGSAVEVFKNGRSLSTGRSDLRLGALPGLVDGLGVRSELVSALEIAGQRRGVLQVLSAQEEFFSPEEDLPFIEAVARWIGMVAHRAELVERATDDALETGRRAATDERLKLLTPRQLEVADLIAAGLTNEEIAKALVLTPGSVANHIERIFQRLGVARRTQIAIWIVNARNHIIEIDHDGSKPKSK